MDIVADVRLMSYKRKYFRFGSDNKLIVRKLGATAASNNYVNKKSSKMGKMHKLGIS